eukprot:m.144440 g.144440  ORF g.144440 m.144440 type:complete len:523 (+) comp30373_c1_seq1:354-1922(+)
MDSKRERILAEVLDDSDEDDWGIGSSLNASLLLDTDRGSGNESDSDVPKKMARTLGLTGGISIIMGTMIGSGIFASPGVVLAQTGSVALSLLAWLAAGVISLLGSLCYTELGTMIPSSGGEYAYIKMAFGDLGAFVYIWATVLITKPCSLAIICVVSGEYLVQIFTQTSDSGGWQTTVAGVCLLALVTVVNAVSVTCASRVNIIFTTLKLLALSSIGLLGFIWIFRDGTVIGTAAHTNYAHPFAHSKDSLSNFGVATLAGLWSFDGWNNLNLVVEELKNPAKILPRALFAGVSLVTTLYIVANIGYFAVMDLNQIVIENTTNPVEGFATAFGLMTLGETGKVMLPLCIAVSTFGAANGSAFTGGRLLQVSARNGDFPKFLSTLHGKHHPRPVYALVAQGALGITFVVLGDFKSLLAGFSVVAWIFYLMAVLCVFIFRWREPNRPRPFRVWLMVPVVFCSISVILVIATFIQQPRESILALILICTAFPVYLLRKWLRYRGYISTPPASKPEDIAYQLDHTRT